MQHTERAPHGGGDRESPRRRLRLPVDDAVAMGVIFYLLIVATIVLCSVDQYRFFYGTF